MRRAAAKTFALLLLCVCFETAISPLHRSFFSAQDDVDEETRQRENLEKLKQREQELLKQVRRWCDSVLFALAF